MARSSLAEVNTKAKGNNQEQVRNFSDNLVPSVHHETFAKFKAKLKELKFT